MEISAFGERLNLDNYPESGSDKLLGFDKWVPILLVGLVLHVDATNL